MTNKDKAPILQPDQYSRLAHIPKFGNGIGLHRTRWLLSEFESSPWFSSLKTVRVTGSNGKGSVCAMLTAIFSALDISCGTYTSPHLLRFNERYVLNKSEISDADLSISIDWLLKKEKEYYQLFPDDKLSGFEAFTALGMHYYAHHEPRVIVAEAGIGGRFDATRALPGNLVGLVSLDLEHTEFLGNTLELIAYDKADLCPDGGTLVVGEIDPDVLRRLEGYCDLRHIQLVSYANNIRVDKISFAPDFMSLDIQVEDLRFADLKLILQGFHQVNNAAVAIMLARRWIAQEMPQVTLAQFIDAVYAGLRNTFWPGRFERISEQPEIYIDVGHTPDGIDHLVHTVGEALRGRKILLVTGVSYNKKVSEIVERLVQVADAVICTRAYHKGSDVSAIVKAVENARPELPRYQAETIEAAMQMALEIANSQGMTVLVAGGLFLAIEAAQAFRGRDPQALNFF